MPRKTKRQRMHEELQTWTEEDERLVQIDPHYFDWVREHARDVHRVVAEKLAHTGGLLGWLTRPADSREVRHESKTYDADHIASLFKGGEDRWRP